MQQRANHLNPQESLAIQTLTDGQSAYLISETELRLEANMKELTKLEPSMKEYYNAYLAMKADYDGYLAKIDADKQMLEMLSKMKNGIPLATTLRVLRSESHNDMKPREQRKLSEAPKRTYKPRIPWTEYAAQVLTIERKFIPPKELFTIVSKEFGLEKLYKEQGKHWEIGVVRWGIINNCWLPSCERSKGGDKNGVLVHVEGRIGLRDWVTDDMKLRPEFVVNH